MPYRPYHAGTFLALAPLYVHPGGRPQQFSLSSCIVHPYGRTSSPLYGEDLSSPIMRPDQKLMEAVRATIAEVERAHEMAVEAIEVAEPSAALLAVNELTAAMRKLADADVVLRTQTAGRVWDAERLSLAALAERVGVSKSRAEQMIKEVKKGKGDSG